MSLEGQLQSALHRYHLGVSLHRNVRSKYKQKIIKKLTSPPAFVGAFAFGFITSVRTSSTSSKSQIAPSHDSQRLTRWARFQNLRRTVLKTYGTWLAVRTALATHLNSSSQS